MLVCRLFSLFGESQRRLLVWELYRQFKAMEAIVWLEGTGDETRDYLHADDASGAILELASSLSEQNARDGCTVVNVASGEETRVLDLAEQLRALVAPSKEIRCRGQARAGDPRRWRADASLLRSLAPRWRPRSFAQRFAQCIAAWREEENAATDF